MNPRRSGARFTNWFVGDEPRTVRSGSSKKNTSNESSTDLQFGSRNPELARVDRHLADAVLHMTRTTNRSCLPVPHPGYDLYSMRRAAILLGATWLASGFGAILAPSIASATSTPVESRSSSAATPAPSTYCPSSPLMGVYDPDRLEVLKTCQTFRGVVLFVKHEEDGDYHVVMKPDPGYSSYLNDDNLRYQDSGLVAEIMQRQRFPLPFAGEHIAMFGTWVLDRDYGWDEMHPVWAITNLATG